MRFTKALLFLSVALTSVAFASPSHDSSADEAECDEMPTPTQMPPAATDDCDESPSPNAAAGHIKLSDTIAAGAMAVAGFVLV